MEIRSSAEYEELNRQRCDHNYTPFDLARLKTIYLNPDVALLDEQNVRLVQRVLFQFNAALMSNFIDMIVDTEERDEQALKINSDKREFIVYLMQHLNPPLSHRIRKKLCDLLKYKLELHGINPDVQPIMDRIHGVDPKADTDSGKVISLF